MQESDDVINICRLLRKELAVDCEEVLERNFKLKKSIFVKNLGAHFTLKISANQRFGTNAINERFKRVTFYCTVKSRIKRTTFKKLKPKNFEE